MKTRYYVTNAEWEILEVLWQFPEGINQSRLLECMNMLGKDWKRQTLNTFITRLEEKELVRREKRNVWAVMNKKEYAEIQAEEIIDRMFDGKISILMEAFIQKNKVSKMETERLRKLLDTYKIDI